MERIEVATEVEVDAGRHRDICDDVADAERRLTSLLELNSVAAEPPAPLPASFPFRSSSTRSDHERVFSILGFSLGLLPPAAILYRMSSPRIFTAEPEVLAILVLIIVGSSVTGLLTGRVMGRIARELEKLPLAYSLLTLPFLGIVWGIVAGGIGGAFALLIGAIPGAVLGAMVGGVALPAFGLLHRWLSKRSGFFQSQMYPLAVGIAALVGGVIAGFPS